MLILAGGTISASLARSLNIYCSISFFQRYPFAWRKLLERYLSLGGLTVLVVPEASRAKSEGRALICSAFKTSDSSCFYHGMGFSVIDINSHPKHAMLRTSGDLCIGPSSPLLIPEC